MLSNLTPCCLAFCPASVALLLLTKRPLPASLRSVVGRFGVLGLVAGGRIWWWERGYAGGGGRVWGGQQEQQGAAAGNWGKDGKKGERVRGKGGREGEGGGEGRGNGGGGQCWDRDGDEHGAHE